MKMTKRMRCGKRFREITHFTDNRRFLRNVNKENPTVSDMTQDAGYLLAEISKLAKPLK